MHSLELCYYAANLGDSRTLVVQPWTTTQSQLSEQSKAENGTRIEGIRISLGLEDVEDVKKGECGWRRWGRRRLADSGWARWSGADGGFRFAWGSRRL